MNRVIVVTKAMKWFDVVKNERRKENGKKEKGKEKVIKNGVSE